MSVGLANNDHRHTKLLWAYDWSTAQDFDCGIVIYLIVEKISVLFKYSLAITVQSWNVSEIMMRLRLYTSLFGSVWIKILKLKKESCC